MTFFVRYRPEISLADRKHGPTVGRFDSWEAAEDHRLAQPWPFPDRLEVVERVQS